MSANELPGVNDLARVAEVCGCDGSLRTRNHFVGVTAILVAQENVLICCGYCKQELGHLDIAMLDTGGAHPRAWLRRIPPLSDLESIHIADELDAERKDPA